MPESAIFAPAFEKWLSKVFVFLKNQPLDKPPPAGSFVQFFINRNGSVA